MTKKSVYSSSFARDPWTPEMRKKSKARQKEKEELEVNKLKEEVKKLKKIISDLEKKTEPK